MRWNNEKIYQYLLNEKSHHSKHLFTASEVSHELHLSRSYVSHLFNELVELGKLKKSKTRPVIYSLVNHSIIDYKAPQFEHLPGHDGLYAPAIRMAKAVLHYPHHQLYAMIVGEASSAKSTFARMMYEYGLKENLFSKSSEFRKINCMNYIDYSHQLISELFSEDGLIQQVNKNDGLLFIDNAQILPASALNQLFHLAETTVC